MPDQDCYLFIDPSVPEQERTMSVMCVQCHDEKMPEIGSFYKGSIEGYSPFEWKCDLCGAIIHQADHDENDEEKTA